MRVYGVSRFVVLRSPGGFRGRMECFSGDYIDFRILSWDYRMRWQKQRLEPTKPSHKFKPKL
jgi:hypothetical protein